MHRSILAFLCAGLASSLQAAPLLESPWPKFRADFAQTGRSSVLPQLDDRKPWVFKTGKGIFSSAAVGSSGEIYVGSADRNFYAIDAEGHLLWKVSTGEIIDSSALLDKDGRVYFGSGDGFLRALDRRSGAEIWRFAADAPSVTGGIINWFEGNVAMGADGTLYVPNDNFRLYAIDRDSGSKDWHFPLNDQTWSSPAVDIETGHLYFGSNYIAPLKVLQPIWKNIFALDAKGKLLWRQSVQASVAASPLLSQAGLVVVGAFDGKLYAYEKQSGKLRWSFASQDHLYASPAEQSDGTIIQASTDGHVYAVDGRTGSLKWSFAAGEPIRSSPALDGAGNIYFGSGDGALYVLEPTGTLRFRMQLIEADRNDLNASPALTRTGVVIAGENGEIWSIPYDYCLRGDGLGDARCSRTHSEPADGVSIGFLTPFGSLKAAAPEALAAAESLALSIQGVEGSKPVKAVFDEARINVSAASGITLQTRVTGDGKTLIVTPAAVWPEGETSLQMDLGYELDGKVGTLKRSVRFATRPKAEFVTGEALYSLRRLAVPIPTIMPSYNQIGFDSLSYVIRVLETKDGRGTAWVMAGIEDALGQVRVDPASKANFALAWTETNQGLVLESRGGFTANAMNLDIPFSSFRLGLIEAENGTAVFGALASTVCNEIPTYGYFLKNLGFCSAKEGRLTLSGAAEIKPLPLSEEALASIVWQAGKTWLGYATIEAVIDAAEEGLYSLVLVDADTLMPVDIDYQKLVKTRSEHGLKLSLPYASGPSRVKAFLLKGEAVQSTEIWTKNTQGVYEKG